MTASWLPVGWVVPTHPTLQPPASVGCEPERKQALVDAIAAVLKAALRVDPADHYVLFRETPAPDHYTGGTPLAAWVPADG